MFAVFLPIQEDLAFGRFFRILGSFFHSFYLGYGCSGQMMVPGNFRCRGVLFFWIMVGQKPFVLAVGKVERVGRGSGEQKEIPIQTD